MNVPQDFGHRDFDPVTLEVIRHRLDTIAEEMETTLLKSSCSPIVKEGLDASASLFTLDGVTLAQACAIPIHLGTLIPAVGAIIQAFPVARMQEGDVYILNDPYMRRHAPARCRRRHAGHGGWPPAGSGRHHDAPPGRRRQDGRLGPDRLDRDLAGGLRLPPLRWARAGEFDAGLTGILRLNTRMPDIFLGDLHAQIAACKVAAMRLGEMAERHGANVLPTVFDLLLTKSEEMTRAALSRLPQGTWNFVDWLDNDGVDIDRRIRIEVTVTLENGEAHFDLTGTSEQVRGPVNCVPSGSLAAACYAVRAVTDPTIPNNGGCFRPIRLTLPEGSLVNPTAPAPVNARTATIKRITGCMLGALAQAQPDRAPAPHAGELVVMAFGGQRRDGSGFVTGDLLAGGSGAAPDRDGVDAIETDATNCMSVPAEAMELEAPIRVRRCELRRDTGGAGAFRGGLGLVKEFEILDDVRGPVSFSHRGERHFHPAGGARGGSSGGLAEFVDPARLGRGRGDPLQGRDHAPARRPCHRGHSRRRRLGRAGRSRPCALGRRHRGRQGERPGCRDRLAAAGRGGPELTRTIEKFIRAIALALAVVAGIALLLMMIQTVVDVTMNNLFGGPIEGNLEIMSVYHMVALVFLPLAIVELKHEHITVDLLVRLFPTRRPTRHRYARLPGFGALFRHPDVADLGRRVGKFPDGRDPDDLDPDHHLAGKVLAADRLRRGHAGLVVARLAGCQRPGLRPDARGA